jgi:hypothetical protein
VADPKANALTELEKRIALLERDTHPPVELAPKIREIVREELTILREPPSTPSGRTLRDYAKHDLACRKGKPTEICPGCGGKLEWVRQSSNSTLNSDQFDAVKAGDYFCRVCLGGESQSNTFKYWWTSDLLRSPSLGETPAPTARRQS